MARFSGSIGFTGVLTILFCALKAAGEVKWPWWWAVSPLWLPPVLVMGHIVTIALMEIIRDAAVRQELRRIAASTAPLARVR
jgi:hypothetical protein